MSLRILNDLIQGSEEWLAARRGMVTASVVGKLISVAHLAAIDYDCPDCSASAGSPCVSKVKRGGEYPIISKAHSKRADLADANKATSPLKLGVSGGDDALRLTRMLVAERISGNTDPTYMTMDMFRGVEDEPRAIEVYSKHHDQPVDTLGFMVRDDWSFDLGYSPDGLVGDDGLLEVKSRRQGTQLGHVLSNQVPVENMAQLQAGLLVSGRKWIDYLSHCGGMALWIKRIYPDPLWFEVIIAACEQFEDNAADMTARYNAAVVGLPMTERASDMEIVI